jgi:hypothetical protein
VLATKKIMLFSSMEIITTMRRIFSHIHCSQFAWTERRRRKNRTNNQGQRSQGSQASRESKNWNSGASKSRVYNRSKNQVERGDVHLANT